MFNLVAPECPKPLQSVIDVFVGFHGKQEMARSNKIILSNMLGGDSKIG